MLCGFYERLISLMDVANAVVALIDEDQKSAVHALFDRLCILYDSLIEKYKKYYNPDIILMHDDWGHQHSTFFSPETYEEMILPYITRLVESCHKRGILYEQHSCGKNERLVPYMVKAGIDIWQGQDMNDKAMLVDKYGKDIFLGVTVPILPPGTSDEEQYKNAEAFVNQYKGKRMFATVMAFDRTYEYVYKLGRIACSK
jgi:uroporphyrinogen-III decarboxylase